MISSMKTADAATKYTSMYIFGDSLIDNGNNINFPDSLAKANYPPYGIDFPTGPTGRFCNGKIVVDFIAEMIGLPLIPSYADTSADTQYGVNYASAGAGILADTGHYFGRVIPLSEQIGNFKKTVAGLRKRAQEKEVSMHLGNALVFVDMGANDYLNNYLNPGLYPSGLIYTSREFADLLTKQFKQQILEIQGLGLRHFLIAEASPIGCAPVEVSNDECNSSANNMVEMFNMRLEPLVRSLGSEFPGSAFAVAPSFQVFTHVYDNAEAYGFKVKDQGCCGRSANGGTKPLCLRNSVPCPNRDGYLFWDYAHPTEAANRVLARLIYNATQLPTITN
ncbi:hypothetical protein C2S51_023928 [Perilla frutescens var. frutescens]|nr:hypothetical protein C2S51_023928 [Perilla frutescens var. frutescens]